MRTIIGLLGIFIGLTVINSQAGAAPASVDDKPLDAEVIVVGAGLAGLAAASALQQQGVKVLVLEARDRLGGRAWTIKHKGAALEMGASWLHSKDSNSLLTLAETLNLNVSKVTNWQDSANYDAFGERLEDDVRWMLQWQKVVEGSVAWYIDNEPDASVQQLLDDVKKSGKLSFVSEEQHQAMVDLYIGHDFATEAGQLSVQALWEGEDYRGDDPLLPQGYGQLVDHLGQGLDIRLNQAVSAIDYAGDQVQLRSANNTYRANQVVVTVSVGVLQSGAIEFTPRLPHRKLQALSRLGMATLNKVWLEFEQNFWDDKEVFFVIGEEQGKFISWLNFHKYTGQFYLLGFNGAGYGEQIELQADADIVEDAILSLQSIYGDAVTEPKSYFISRWKNDSFSLGSYAYLRPGGRGKHRTVIAEPIENKIFFAGEATDRAFPATTQGAYNSGLREAAKVLKSRAAKSARK